MSETLFLDPQKILDKIELRRDMIICDFGCGAGGWVIPLARVIKKGKIYAVDIQEEMLSALESQANVERIFNIETILCDLEKIQLKLEDNTVDLVLMTNLLFQLDDKKQVFQEGERILKNGGKVLVVDWKKKSSLGPREGRITPAEIKKLAKEVGLELDKEFEAGDYHFGLLFTKP